MKKIVRRFWSLSLGTQTTIVSCFHAHVLGIQCSYTTVRLRTYPHISLIYLGKWIASSTSLISCSTSLVWPLFIDILHVMAKTGSNQVYEKSVPLTTALSSWYLYRVRLYQSTKRHL
jgi:hypothetical protein